MCRAQVQRQKGQRKVPAFSAGSCSAPGAMLRWAVGAQRDLWAWSPEHEVGFHKNTDWEMHLPALDITTPTVCAHSISWGIPLPLHRGSASATTPSWHFQCFWGSAGSLVPFPELFCPVASTSNNSGANKRTFECSADGTCHTGKINPQICSLMVSSCRQMLSCEAASSQTDYFLAHIVYRRATPGISSFALQQFSKHSQEFLSHAGSSL